MTAKEVSPIGLHNNFPFAQWLLALLHEENYEGWDMHYKSKKPDGLLHPSSHTGCEIAMCHDMDPDIPPKPQSSASLMRLLIGTLVHAWIEGGAQSGDWEGIEFKTEVKMGEGLPPGWEGSCDIMVGQFGDGKLSEAEWVIGDFKTIAGNGVSFLDINRPKPEQHFQISAYYHAAEAMGYRLHPECCIVHVPVSAAQYKEILPPIEQWMKPLPRNVVFGEMRRRSQILKRYQAGETGAPQPMPKVIETKANKRTGQIEQIEKPHWSVRYCRSTQCACASQAAEVVAYLTDKDITEEVGSL